jgi:hypothetical protein
MRKIRILRLNEWHPGAKEIDESIRAFMERGEYELNIPREDLLDAARLLIIHHEGGSIKNMYSRDSDLYRAMVHMELCIDTIIDDGYPIKWILTELKKVIEY